MRFEQIAAFPSRAGTGGRPRWLDLDQQSHRADRHAPRATPRAAGRLQFQAATPTLTHTGTIIVTLNITIHSTIPTGQTLSCQVDASASDDEFTFSYTEEASVNATRRGNTAICTATIPYSWKLGTGGGYAVSYLERDEIRRGRIRS